LYFYNQKGKESALILENAKGKHRRRQAANHHAYKPLKALRSNLLNFLIERQRFPPR